MPKSIFLDCYKESKGTSVLSTCIDTVFLKAGKGGQISKKGRQGDMKMLIAHVNRRMQHKNT